MLPDFVSTSEEQSLLKEVARALRRSKYQYDHWDGVSGYVTMWVWGRMSGYGEMGWGERVGIFFTPYHLWGGSVGILGAVSGHEGGYVGEGLGYVVW